MLSRITENIKSNIYYDTVQLIPNTPYCTDQINHCLVRMKFIGFLKRRIGNVFDIVVSNYIVRNIIKVIQFL